MESQRLRTAEILSTTQENTALDSTPQRSPLLSLLLSHTLISYVSCQKITKKKNIRKNTAKKSFQSLAGSRLCVAGNLGEHKKGLVIILAGMVLEKRLTISRRKEVSSSRWMVGKRRSRWTWCCKARAMPTFPPRRLGVAQSCFDTVGEL